MRIELANLDEGKGDFAHVYHLGDLDLSDDRATLCGPVSVAGRIEQSGTEVFVKGHLDACTRLECDRCLKPLELKVGSDFSLEYITDSEYAADETAELSDESMSVSVFDGEGIDLDEVTKEQVLLAIPTRSLCRDDCKGICPTCGVDKNRGECHCSETKTDPRWDSLKSLVDGK